MPVCGSPSADVVDGVKDVFQAHSVDWSPDASTPPSRNARYWATVVSVLSMQKLFEGVPTRTIVGPGPPFVQGGKVTSAPASVDEEGASNWPSASASFVVFV